MGNFHLLPFVSLVPSVTSQSMLSFSHLGTILNLLDRKDMNATSFAILIHSPSPINWVAAGAESRCLELPSGLETSPSAALLWLSIA